MRAELFDRVPRMPRDPSISGSHVGRPFNTLAAIPVFWFAIFFTPEVTLPGAVPLRLDDVVAFSLVATWILAQAVGARLRKPSLIGWSLLLNACVIVALTAGGPPVSVWSVGLKEFLDPARLLKFLAVLVCVEGLDYGVGRRALVRLIPPTVFVLVLLALAQVLIVDTHSTGLLAQFLLLFKETEEATRLYFGFRAFGTFPTPTDFAYVMGVFFFAAAIWKDVPHRGAVGAAAVVGVALSGTRTILFMIPPLLIAAAILQKPRFTQHMRPLMGRFALVAAGLGVAALAAPAAFDGFVYSVQSLLAGDLSADESIRLRLGNLFLAEETLSAAPWTGVITRDFVDSRDLVAGVDSEYLLTFHRYGILGLLSLLAIHVAVLCSAWRIHRSRPDLAILLAMLSALTAGYAITQGAIINSRIGSLLFLFAGLAAARNPGPLRP